jgi:hypothetical protein
LQKSAKADDDCGKVEEAEVEITVTFEANAEATESVEPREEALNFPPVRGDFAMSSSSVMAPTAWFDVALWNAVANAASMKVFTEFTTVITAVAGQRARTATRSPVATRHLN